MTTWQNILPLWEVRAVIAQEIFPGQYGPPTSGKMYVHGFNRADARDRAKRIMGDAHGAVRGYFVNTHEINPNEADMKKAGFPGLEMRIN